MLCELAMTSEMSAMLGLTRYVIKQNSCITKLNVHNAISCTGKKYYSRQSDSELQKLETKLHHTKHIQDNYNMNNNKISSLFYNTICESRRSLHHSSVYHSYYEHHYRHSPSQHQESNIKMENSCCNYKSNICVTNNSSCGDNKVSKWSNKDVNSQGMWQKKNVELQDITHNTMSELPSRNTLPIPQKEEQQYNTSRLLLEQENKKLNTLSDVHNVHSYRPLRKVDFDTYAATLSKRRVQKHNPHTLLDYRKRSNTTRSYNGSLPTILLQKKEEEEEEQEESKQMYTSTLGALHTRRKEEEHFLEKNNKSDKEGKEGNVQNAHQQANFTKYFDLSQHQHKIQEKRKTEEMEKELLEENTNTSHTLSSSSLTHTAHKPNFDPALVVHVNSHTKQIHLNHVQKELIWRARCGEYQGLLQRIVFTLHSHRTPLEKCMTLIQLHEHVISRRLRLRTDTYEDVFHLFYAVAVHGSISHTTSSSSSSSSSISTEKNHSGHIKDNVHLSSTNNDNTFECRESAIMHEELYAHNAHDFMSLPSTFSSSLSASQTILSEYMMQQLWRMYRYAIDSGTEPSSRLIQYVMGLLEMAHETSSIVVEARAHSLMMDCDRFQLLPTSYTLHSYIAICDKCHVMHLALARFTDWQVRLEQPASPSMYSRLLFGLARHNMIAEAMSLITTVHAVSIDNYLLNAILHVARFSSDPLSAFTFYRALVKRNRKSNTNVIGPTSCDHTVVPSIHTFTIFVEVMVKTHQYSKMDFILHEMQFYRIKGNTQLLNKLLHLLLKLHRTEAAHKLYKAMLRKHVTVFDEHVALLRNTS